ncbi:MAG: hypothetical protein ACTSPY_05865 [Candidatus Helarchaeota archaeon]
MDDKFKNILKEIKKLRRDIQDIERNFHHIYTIIKEFYIYTRERDYSIPKRSYEYAYSKHTTEKYGEFENLLMHARKDIMKTKQILQRLEISQTDASLFFVKNAFFNTDFVASHGLLSICNKCKHQLQILIEKDAIYLTCPSCGRWLWQGLKHE